MRLVQIFRLAELICQTPKVTTVYLGCSQPSPLFPRLTSSAREVKLKLWLVGARAQNPTQLGLACPLPGMFIIDTERINHIQS